MDYQRQRKDIDNTTLLDLYKRMLKPRMIEDKMLILLRQGKISKWFSGICLLYTSPSPRDGLLSRMPSSA